MFTLLLNFFSGALARMMDECVHRILRHKTVMDALASIPTA